MDNLTFGERISLLRRRKKMTQKKLAEKAKISQPNLCKYELDQMTPSVEMIKKLVVALDTTADYLLFGEKQ